MFFRQLVILFIYIIFLISTTLSDVPSPTIHQPNIPYFLESMQFQTMQMNIFPRPISGMVTDTYSDLQWNPAYIFNHSAKSLYFDFNPLPASSIFAIPVETIYQNYDEYSNNYRVLPRWYPTSSVNTLQTAPLYNFASLLTISSNLKIGFINRSIFDYGPFRSSYSYWDATFWRDESALLYGSGLEPKRMEVDENQQTVMGTQTEVIVGYKLKENIDLGFKLGHYVYNRDGNLYNSKWAVYPHSSFADLNDETMEIDGNHLEVGIGLLYKLGSKTRFGVYAGLNRGDGTEGIASLDTADSWSEKDTNPAYYSIREYSLESQDTYSSTGTKPTVTITFERVLSENLIFRSFFYGSKSNLDISGSVSSSDTTYGDRTYDVWDRDTEHYYFQRRESHGSRESGLNGSGEENKNHWKCFVSLIYAPDEVWSAFAGIQVQNYTLNQEFDETSDYFTHDWSNYTGFETKNIRNYYRQVKDYAVERNFEKWSLILPIGIKAKIVSGLNIILGTDVSFTLQDQKAKGELLYTERITNRWEDGTLVVNDEEYDRYEEYSSNPEKVFNRSIGQRFGLTYDHPSGARLFIRSGGDIFNTANWGLGFEMNF